MQLSVETAMCDNFKGWGNFLNNTLGIPSNCRLQPEHGTGMVGTAGIAAEKYSHTQYFPNRAAYNDYYDIDIFICEVWVESSAMLVLEMLIEYLSTKYGQKFAVGVATSGRASVEGCVSHIICMQGASTTWVWMSHGV